MAYASKLNEDNHLHIYTQLKERADKALDKAVQSEIAKTGTCKPGFFPNPWTKVLNLWLKDKVTNLEVYDMLLIDQVSVEIEMMDYQETI